ncbi:hypothetical protein [Lactococcus lactis]|uniref:hypothetical protein n=1 Tax=Lactococcus lactis TaxID=1358 RepID=UPI0018C5DE8C|nr:hypothetical protein [Lactococcus lactis]MBG1277879.1 hypothetical protein [Lactococcus lactis subsp. lactis]
MNEEQKTIKEFADELNMDKKQLQNKLNYWKKKGAETWNFSDTFSDGVRTLTKPEQERVCELLGIPIFRQSSDGFQKPKNDENVELLKEQIATLEEDKKFLQAQLETQNQANAEMRILLQNSLKQLSEKVSEIYRIENLETVDTKEIDKYSEVSEKPSENEELFWKMNPNYKGYWNERLRPLREGKWDRQSWRLAKLRAYRLKTTLEKIEKNKKDL